MVDLPKFGAVYMRIASPRRRFHYKITNVASSKPDKDGHEKPAVELERVETTEARGKKRIVVFLDRFKNDYSEVPN